MSEPLDYRGAKILAPMVRIGTYPMRALSVMYGADIVYTEELVDKKLIATQRLPNKELGTVDFVDKAQKVIFRTGPAEHGRVVLQLGSGDAVSALRAAELVSADVAGVDLNMGCPMSFSLQGGMGAALLKKPEAVEDILKTLRRNLTLPISCKMRLLEDIPSTVELARRALSCDIASLAIHGRQVEQRSRTPAHWDLIKEVVSSLSAASLSQPIIGNGDVYAPADFERLCAATGCAAGMTARGAMWNPSIFRTEGFLPLGRVQRDFVLASLACQAPLPNVKAILRGMAEGPAWFGGTKGTNTAAARERATADAGEAGEQYATRCRTCTDVDAFHVDPIYGHTGLVSLQGIKTFRQVAALVGLTSAAVGGIVDLESIGFSPAFGLKMGLPAHVDLEGLLRWTEVSSRGGVAAAGEGTKRKRAAEAGVMESADAQGSKCGARLAMCSKSV